MIGKGRGVEGSVQHADEQLGLLPAPVEAEDELVQIAWRCFGLTPWKVPRSQVFRFPKTVCAQGNRWTGWRP